MVKRIGLIILLTLMAGMASAETFRVGIKPVPPFAMSDGEGGWNGISVELWQRVANQLGWQTEWVVMETPRDQIEGLAAGTIDIAVGALSMTTEREELMDFSHTFYSTGLAIATPVKSDSLLAMLSQLLSPAFLNAVGILVLVLLVVGALLWLVERKRNPSQFGGSLLKGIGNGFWWSAVTMTTVGYGDKSPVTMTGRILATIWMFVSIITISGFTAAIASSITLNQYSTTIKGVNDLGHVRTIAVEGSIAQSYLQKKGIAMRTVATPAEGLELLRLGKAEAMVHDELLLRYLLKDADSGIELLPQTIERQDYAFGLKPGFAQRESFNRVLLSQMHSSSWQEILNRYLGQR